MGFDPQALTSLTVTDDQGALQLAFRSTGSYEPDQETKNWTPS